MNIETMLHEEITEELNALSDMEFGTDEYKTTVDGIAKLMDRAIEMEKLNAEDEWKNKQAKEERKDRLIRNCMTAAGIIVPTVLTIWGTLKSFEFEKEGTVTTIMGRGFINKLLPKK